MGVNQLFSISSAGSEVRVSMEVDRLDLNIADELATRLTTEISGHRGNVVLDMSNVTFVDSSGLGALVRLKKNLSGSADVKLRNPNQFVAKVLRLTNLDNLFDVPSHE